MKPLRLNKIVNIWYIWYGLWYFCVGCIYRIAHQIQLECLLYILTLNLQFVLICLSNFRQIYYYSIVQYRRVAFPQLQGAYFLDWRQQPSRYSHVRLSVCMNTQITTNIRASVTKIAENVFYYWPHFMLILEFGHTFCHSPMR